MRCAPVALYLALALWATWPLARSATTSVPLGDSSFATVPLFNVWTTWWNADRLRHAFAGYWDAPIFHPAADVFAFSEPQPATLVVAPLIWATGSRVLAYNVYLWLSLILNGVCTQRLLRRLGCGMPIAVSGAAAMILLPIVHWQRDVVQLVPVWPILWSWTALLGIARRATVWRGVGLGTAFGVACLTCVHQGLFLAILLAGAACTLGGRWRTLTLWKALGAAMLVSAVITAPIIVPMQRTLARYGFARSAQSVARLSALPGDYTAAFGRQWIDPGDLAARPEWRLSPGGIKSGLALLGIGYGITRRRWRWWTAFLLLTGVLAFSLSLGGNLRFGGWHPYWTLMDHVPGLSRVRNVFRLAFFVQLVAALLAFQGLHALWNFGRCARRGGVRRLLFRTSAVLLTFAAVFEVVPTVPRLATVPDAVANAGWISIVREQTPRGRAVACLPFAPGNDASDFESTTRWMYLATFHEARLVNGYSGFFPVMDFELRRIIGQSFPSEVSLACLGGSGVELIVCQRSPALPVPLPRGPFGRFRLEHVYADPVGVDVYRLRREGT